MSLLKPHQKTFIDFLVRSEALLFGDFVTKSGRKTPYFVNTGRLNDGEKISQLGDAYAAHLHALGLIDIDTIFGPAYKGIPLAVATASSLLRLYDRSVGFTFDRKEEKGHGDKGLFVGFPISEGMSLVIVEDVITAGTTLRHIIPLLRDFAHLEISAVLISVDRAERGTGSLSAKQEVEQSLSVPVHAIVSIHDIRSYLSVENSSGLILRPEQSGAIDAYLEEYGVAQG